MDSEHSNDARTDILEMQLGVGQSRGLSLLKEVEKDPTKLDPQLINWLWERAKTQEYAFDDLSMNRVEAFLLQLADQSTHYLMIGDKGLFIVLHPIQGGTAEVHFMIWEREFSLYQHKEYVWELLDWLFYEKKVHRVQGTIPTYNKLAERFMYAIGMKFEGEMLEAVLWKGKYYNVKLFGMLERHYRSRKDRIIQ